MNNRCLLSCPELDPKIDLRIKSLKTIVTDWIQSEAFKELIKMFNGSVRNTGDLKEQIDYYFHVSSVWDYRLKTANGGERWLVTEDEFLSEHKKEIMEYVSLLGFTRVLKPVQRPDYILPLGGARMANLERCMMAHAVSENYKENNIPIFALTGMRPISEIERPYLDQYAHEAQTEYDAICSGMIRAFALSDTVYEEKIHSNVNVNLAWAERKYIKDSREIHILSAPSSDSGRRANSMDTFTFFQKKYNLEPGTKVLLITSCIYVPYQLMKFIDLALLKGLYVDCIGSNDYSGGPSVLNVASYLQELKATINAIYQLSERYF